MHSITTVTPIQQTILKNLKGVEKSESGYYLNHIIQIFLLNTSKVNTITMVYD